MQLSPFTFVQTIVLVAAGCNMLLSACARAIPIEARSQVDGSGDARSYVRCERGMKPPGQRVVPRREGSAKTSGGGI